MGSTSCTAHRLEIRRALYLITSNKKFISLIEVKFIGKIWKIGNNREVMSSPYLPY